MAYWPVKWPASATKRPIAQKSQPMGLVGRREAMIAPAIEKLTGVTVFSSQYSQMAHPAWEECRYRKSKGRAGSTKESAHTDQASQVALRVHTILLLLLVLALIIALT